MVADIGIGPHNLAALAERSYEVRGDYPSLLFEGGWHSSGELLQRSRRIAAGLGELGIGPGERVVVTMANCPEVAILYQAIWRAGAVVTPATFLLPPEDLRHIVADAEAAAVVTTPEFVDKVQAAVAGVPSVRAVICTGDAAPGVTPLESLERAQPAAIVDRDDSDLAALLYTGGTTALCCRPCSWISDRNACGSNHRSSAATPCSSACMPTIVTNSP